MRWIDIIRISVRMLRTNGLRSLLTILGIGVAISLIVILIGMGYGLQNITIGTIVSSKTLLSLDISPPPKEAVPLTLNSVEDIKKVPGIREVTPVITTSGELRIEEKLASLAITAANPAYLEMQGVTVTNGGPYAEDSTDVVVSNSVLELLDLSSNGIVGSFGKLTYTDPNNQSQSFTIDKVRIAGTSETDDAATIYVPYSLLQEHSQIPLTQIKAVAQDRDALASARTALEAKGYIVETLIQTLDQARTVFRWFTIGLAAFGTIALVVAAIGMFNTLTISLLERTREIGIMKAIGVTDQTVKRLFLTEAAMLGFLGGLSGIGIGLLADVSLGGVLNQFATRFGGGKLDLFQYPTGFLLLMVLFPIALAVVTGFYPALRAARLNPLRALRYE